MHTREDFNFLYLIRMKKYDIIRKDRNQFLSLTSLYPEEFDLILPHFASLWYRFNKIFTLEGKRRKKKNWYPEKDTKTLPTVEIKLFFLLVYLKQHPLQEFQAFVFGLSQAKVSQWIKILSPMLEESLEKLDCTACRQGSNLSDFLSAFSNTDCINQDVVEQTSPRSTDDESQKAMYSGKKKAHTYKNKVDCLDNQYVVFLSATFLGSVHDKKIADESYCKYPENIRLRQVSGFQGYAPNGVHIVMPFKKPKNGNLTWMKRWFNQYVGQRRIVVEHAIRGIKRCHIVQYPCRLAGYWIRDRMMNICTALHNLRVRSPLREYKFEHKFQL